MTATSPRDTPGRVPSDVAAWLVHAVVSAGRGGAGPDLAPGRLADLAWAADVHGVPGFALRQAECEGRDVEGLRATVRGAVARHQRAVADLRAVSAGFEAAGVEWLVVKGPVLVEQYYGTPALRSSVDLDVLVAPVDLPTSVAALEQAGFALLDGNWPLLRSGGMRELRMLSPTGGALDLHWSLVPPGTPGDGGPTAEQLLASSVEVGLGGVQVRTLSWADTVVHLAVHAASSGGHRLVWVADLREALTAAPADADPPVLLDAAARWQAGPALHLMLVRCRRSLGADVPETLLTGLMPSRAWRAAVVLVDRLDPFERVGTGRGLSRMLARACRGSARSSLRELVVRSVRAARPQPFGHLGPPLDPDDPRSGLFQVGGEQERARFLAEVSRGER